MPVQELINTKGSVVKDDSIQELRTVFRGDVIRLGEDGYENACKIWNAGVQKRPGIVARCSEVADVVAAVNFARENELLAAVRGGGHNVGGRALCDGGLVIDLSHMKDIHVEPAKRTVRVQAARPWATSTMKLTSSGWRFQPALFPERELPD
jgi:FAD/FMN-containing dehydrogenase